MSSFEILQIFAGCVGSFGFGLLFNIRGKKLVAVTLGGFFAWMFFLFLGYIIESEPIRYFIVATLVGIYSEIMARVLKTPTITFSMPCLVPLVPGSSLYYTMAYAFDSDLNKFLNKAIYTLQLAAALAIGTLLVTAVARSIKNNKNSKSKVIECLRKK